MESTERGVSKEAKERVFLTCMQQEKTKEKHPAKNNPKGYPTHKGSKKKDRRESKVTYEVNKVEDSREVEETPEKGKEKLKEEENENLKEPVKNTPY